MNGKTVLILLFQFLLLSVIESVSGQTSKCLAVITEISGVVNIKKTDNTESEKAFWGSQLFQGDQIMTKEKSFVSLLFANSSLIKLEANSMITIAANESAKVVKATTMPEPMTAALISGFSALNSRKVVKEEKGSLAGVRSLGVKVQSIKLISPLNTLIRTTRPSFSWSAKEPYESYTVNVCNSRGLVWSKKTTGTSISYPDNEKDLEYGGYYFWNVEAEKLIDTVRSAKQDFAVASFEKVNETESLENSIRNYLGGESETSNFHSVLGAYFLNEGFLQDAIYEFQIITEINPEAAIPHEILGSIYSETGDKEKAIEELQKALALSKSKER